MYYLRMKGEWRLLQISVFRRQHKPLDVIKRNLISIISALRKNIENIKESNCVCGGMGEGENSMIKSW